MRTVLFIPLLLPAIASAQQVFPPVQLTPPSPTSGDVIRATIPLPGNCQTKSASTVVEGNVVRTTVVQSDCIVVDPPFDAPATAEFGPLPPGTYTYEIYYTTEGGPPQLRSTQTLVVQIAPIPTLSELSLMILAVALAAAAILARLS